MAKAMWSMVALAALQREIHGVRLTTDLDVEEFETGKEKGDMPLLSKGELAAFPDRPECEQYKDLVINERNISTVFTTICQLWPGSFPVQTTNSLLNLLEKTFGPESLWKSLQALQEKRDDWFCSRREVWRPIVSNQSIRCDEDGDWAPVGDWGDGWESCEDHGSLTCQCAEHTLVGGAESGVEVAAACETKKACYDHCPFGYRAAYLHRKPVCTSVCAQSTHPIPCGMGCANSALHCALLAREQAGEVLTATSLVLSIILVNPLIQQIVDTAVDMVEFVARTLWALVKVSREIFSSETKEERILALLLGFFQFGYEMVYNWAADWVDRNERLRSTLDFFWALFDAGLAGDVRKIASIFLHYGPNVILKADDMVGTFQWPRCNVASRDVLFTIDKAGHESIVGPWMQRGSFHGEPRYVKVGSKREKMEWNRWQKRWSIWFLDMTTLSGKFLRWMGLGWRRLYTTEVRSIRSVKIGWELVQGELPLPCLDDVADDGDGENLDGGVQL